MSRSPNKIKGFDPKEFQRPGLSAAQIYDMKEIFDVFDFQRTGLVKISEMIASLDCLGEEPQKQTLYIILKQQLENKQTHLDFYEFLDVMTSRVCSKDSKRNMKKVFSLLDEENKGVISVQTLKKVVKDLGDNIDEEELKEMIASADLDKDGLVTEEDFYVLMTSKNSKPLNDSFI